MTDAQLIEALRDVTRSENELTRERCLGAVDDSRREMGDQIREMRESNSREHAAVIDRLDAHGARLASLEGRFDWPRRVVVKATAKFVAAIAGSGVLGLALAKLVQTILGGN